MPVQLGRYELITPIGRGGMAEVHLALQRGPADFEKLVVVKVLHPELARDPAVIRSLRDEARLVAMLKHPNVVEVYELGEADGQHFLAMEYLEGEPLLAVMEAGHTGPRLDSLSMARLIAGTAEGLEAAHRLKGRDGRLLGLVHDDISLGNIVVLYTGQVKLVDFGVAQARATADATPETTGHLHGKPGYMAPEKLDGKRADPRSDIWSLGVVLWEALAQKRLFIGAQPAEIIREVRYLKIPPPSSANPAVPPELDAIAMRALARDPRERYQTAKALANAIEAVLKARGYAARNDQIAAYMQRTFADRIAAREALVAEVTHHARPSHETLETAFGPIRLPAPAPEPPVRIMVDPQPLALPREAGPRTQREQDKGGRPVLPYVLGTAVVIAILVGMALSTRHDGARLGIAQARVPSAATTTARDARLAIDAQVSEAAIEPDAMTDADELPDADERSDATDPVDAADPVDAVVAVVAADEADPAVAPAKPHSRPAHGKTAQALYVEGMTAMRRGDSKLALSALLASRHANASYAPTWFGLGMLYEQLQNRAAARAAYGRYLKLAPGAPNAQLTRERMGRL